MYKSVEIKEYEEYVGRIGNLSVNQSIKKYYLVVSGKEFMSTVTRHPNKVRKEAEYKRRIRHRIIQTTAGYVCQWFEPINGRWGISSKITENAYAIYPTRAQAQAFFDRIGVVEG